MFPHIVKSRTLCLLPLLNLGNIAFILEKKYDIAIQYWQQVLQIQPTMEHARQGIEAARKQFTVNRHLFHSHKWFLMAIHQVFIRKNRLVLSNGKNDLI